MATSARAEGFAPAKPDRTFAIMSPLTPVGFYPKFGPIPAVVEVTDQTGAWDAAGQSRTLHLADNGRGMTSQELARAQGGVMPGGEGAPERRTGLGIPLARQLIAAHDGMLEIVSRKGAGTMATIRLP